MNSDEDFAAWSAEFEQRLLDCKVLSEVPLLTDVRRDIRLSDYSPLSRPRSKYVINWLGLRRYCIEAGYVRRTRDDGEYLLYRFDVNSGYYSETTVKVLTNDLVEGLVAIAPDILLPTRIVGIIETNIIPYLPDADSLSAASLGQELAGMYTEGEVIPFKNGIYSIKHNRLLPLTSHVFVEHPLSIDFNPSALNDAIRLRYMDIMCGDRSLFELLFEQMGYILYARSFIVPTCTIFYGSGANGKSIVSNVLSKIIGPKNRSSLTLSDMTNSFAVAQAEGKMVNIAPDASSASMNSALMATSNILEFIKKSTSGEIHSFNPKNGKIHDGYGPRKFVFATNVLLNFGGMDGGLARRMYMIPFNASFENDSRVEASFYEKRAEEWFAMQALVSLLCMLRRKMGDSLFQSAELDGEYLVCKASVDMKSEQMVASDTVYHWISETYVPDVMDKDAVRDALIGNIGLYKDYCSFCSMSGRQPKSITAFHSMLKSIYRVGMKRTTQPAQYGDAKEHVYRAVPAETV